jgi:Domain of unknown function (DUF222)/HNH endonuclease
LGDRLGEFQGQAIAAAESPFLLRLPLVCVQTFCYYGYMTTPVVISQSSLSRAVEHAVGDVDAVRTGARVAGVSDREVLEVLEAMVALQRQVNGTVSVLMAVAEQRNAALRTTNTPLESVLAASGQESVRQVRNQVFQASMLAGRPRVHEAAAAGRITLSQARAIRDVVEGLPDSLAQSQKDQAEELLLGAAERLPAEKLRGMTDQILDRVSPQAKDTAEQRQAKLELRDRRAAARRYFRFGAPEDGSIEVRGSLPVLDGVRLKGLVESIAARDYRAAKDVADRAALATTPDQRLADALMKVVAAAQGTGAESGSGGGGIPAGGAQITALMREQDLLDRAAGRGLLADGTEVSAGELRRLVCDAGFVPVVLGGKSEILDLGRMRRLASPALRHAVGLRDGHCAFPGCEVPLHRCELHHVRPWQDGGPTRLNNLVALCVRHHHLCEPAPPEVDANGYARPPDQWRIRMGPDGIPRFVPPSANDAGARPGLVGSGSAGRAATLYAMTLFEGDESLGEADRAGDVAGAALVAVGARPDG